MLVASVGQQHRDLKIRAGNDSDIDNGDISSNRQHVCQREQLAKLDESVLRFTAYPPGLARFSINGGGYSAWRSVG